MKKVLILLQGSVNFTSFFFFIDIQFKIQVRVTGLFSHWNWPYACLSVCVMVINVRT